MLTLDRAMTVEEFEDFSLAEDYSDRRLEWIEGAVIELVSDQKSSRLTLRLAARLTQWVESAGAGYLTGPDGGYRVGAERYLPDIGYISRRRQPEPFSGAYNPLAPDLAVEVLSPLDRAVLVRRKIVNYLNAGVVVWLVDADVQQVEVFVPNQPPVTLAGDDTLDGGEILPGFQVRLVDLFKA